MDVGVGVGWGDGFGGSGEESGGVWSKRCIIISMELLKAS